MKRNLLIINILTVVLLSCSLTKSLTTPFQTDHPAVTSTNTPTKTQTKTSTPTKTQTPSKTSTQTLTITPSSTFTQTLTPTLGRCEHEGEQFELNGYLALLEGSYTLDASSYVIAFYFEKTGSDRVMVKIQGGNQRDSMYFQNRIPYIRNHYGAVIPWMTQGGSTIYKTAYEVTITGTYITRYVDRYSSSVGGLVKTVECTPSIETII